MKIARKPLLDHLRGVWADGLIPEAAFEGPFRCSAVAEDQTILVDAAGLEGAEDLDEPIGILDLDLLCRTLTVSDSEVVEVSVTSGRLIVGAGHSRVALVTADPERVGNHYVAPETMEKVRETAAVADVEGFALDAGAVAEALRVHRLLSSSGGEVATFLLGEEKCGIRFGSGTQNQGLIKLPGVTHAEEEKRQTSAAALKAVLERVDGDARIKFGSGGLVVVEDGAHTYYLSVLEGEED